MKESEESFNMWVQLARKEIQKMNDRGTSYLPPTTLKYLLKIKKINKKIKLNKNNRNLK